MNKKLRLLIIAAVVLGSLMCGYVPQHRTLHAQVVGHFVQLTWPNSASPNVTAYNIYRGQTAGAETKLTQLAAQLAAGTTSQVFNDSTATPGVLTFYKVSSVDSAGVEGPLSNEASAIPLGPPAAPIITVTAK